MVTVDGRKRIDRYIDDPEFADRLADLLSDEDSKELQRHFRKRVKEAFEQGEYLGKLNATKD